MFIGTPCVFYTLYVVYTYLGHPSKGTRRKNKPAPQFLFQVPDREGGEVVLKGKGETKEEQKKTFYLISGKHPHQPVRLFSIPTCGGERVALSFLFSCAPAHRVCAFVLSQEPASW